jgi:hypothetical protein
LGVLVLFAVSGSGSHVTVAGYGTAVMTAVIITVTLRVRAWFGVGICNSGDR